MKDLIKFSQEAGMDDWQKLSNCLGASVADTDIYWSVSKVCCLWTLLGTQLIFQLTTLEGYSEGEKGRGGKGRPHLHSINTLIKYILFQIDFHIPNENEKDM